MNDSQRLRRLGGSPANTREPSPQGGHLRSGLFPPLGPVHSIFLRPFAPPALPGFHATMDALTPVEPVITVPFPDRSPCFMCSSLPTIPSPTTPRRPWNHRSGFGPGPTAWHRPRSTPRRAIASWASHVASRLAATTGRIEFVNLRTGRSPPVAPHPASRRRSFVRIQSSDPTSTRTCTSPTQTTCKRTSPVVPRQESR